MDDEDRTSDAKDGAKEVVHKINGTNGTRVKKERSSVSSTPNGSRPPSRAVSVSPDDKKQRDGGAPASERVTVPKMSRKTSQKNGTVRVPPLFDHLPDATESACNTYQVIPDCMYGSRHMGASAHDNLDCDCTEEWHDDQNHACGEDSDCINRATKMECKVGECNCGNGCQNQRFQRKQYADVSVIKTEKKGFGLRANADLQPNDFIWEYIGEVINEATFRSRMVKYDRENIKHFYFMSLTRSEFVDATKKGNLGRFCNHSCNPNCYVDKWVVGDKLRMGIFALRAIRTGEELVFNYNVDRYGADPQPCYCAEPNCTGFIGGKTQTERATKLSLTTIEALGIDDADGWDKLVAKKPRKKKATEDDEDYVNGLQPRGLDEESVNKVMATLMQCKEKWIAVKLLERLQSIEEDHLRHRVVKMHGYQILKTTLNKFKDDSNVILQVLDILYKLPRLTKNKISDSKIEASIEPLAQSDHDKVAFGSKRLLGVWSKLETAYRIPRKKVDPSVRTPATAYSFDERRNIDRDDPKPVKTLPNVVIPTGPRSSVPHRNLGYFTGQRPRKFPMHQPPLPEGWFTAFDNTGQRYYYDKNNKTTWVRPTAPAEVEPKASEKAQQEQKALQDIIDNITKKPTPRPSAAQTPRQSSTPGSEAKKEKWRSLPMEKQMKIYENTLFPHTKYVMDKFHHKLPRDELKRLAREMNKKLVSSDYKNKRVQDPTAPLSAKQERKVKEHVHAFFSRAVEKYKQHERKKASNTEAKDAAENGQCQEPTEVALLPTTETTPKDDDHVVLSDVENTESTSGSSSDRKRKREDELESANETWSETPSAKRCKDDETAPSTPSCPPPPPVGTPLADTPWAEEERSLVEQEEALMRENEEAQRLAEEAEDPYDPKQDVQHAPSQLEELSQPNKHQAPEDGGLESAMADSNGRSADGPFSLDGQTTDPNKYRTNASMPMKAKELD